MESSAHYPLMLCLSLINPAEGSPPKGPGLLLAAYAPWTLRQFAHGVCVSAPDGLMLPSPGVLTGNGGNHAALGPKRVGVYRMRGNKQRGEWWWCTVDKTHWSLLTAPMKKKQLFKVIKDALLTQALTSSHNK